MKGLAVRNSNFISIKWCFKEYFEVQFHALIVDLQILQSYITYSSYPHTFFMFRRLNVWVIPEKRGIENTLCSG